jgi:hypothetical protein
VRTLGWLPASFPENLAAFRGLTLGIEAVHRATTLPERRDMRMNPIDP